ncbi:hypothetical protein GQ457_09G017840 [Hibiscus cannabinus]
MTEQIKKSQQEMLGQLAQMLGFQLPEKGEASVINPFPKPSNESEGPTFPPGFSPIQAMMQPENQPQVILSRGKAPMNQAGASVPVNIPSTSKDLLGENQAENFVSEMDQLFETDKLKTGTSKEIEDRCKRLEEKLEALEVVDTLSGFEANELSLVLDLILPPKFKVLEFEKYDGTSCPRAHLTMFCRRMTGYGSDDKLLIQYFQDSLLGSTTRWYNQLSRHQIKSNESFRQYAQRWRDVATQVQPPLGEKEMVVIFIQTLDGPILDRLIGNATTNFADLVLSGELIENAVKSSKIDSGGSSSHRKSLSGKRDHEVNSSGVYSVEDWWRSMYKADAHCDFYGGIPGHNIESCLTFKRVVQNLINAGKLAFETPEKPNTTKNPLPSHEGRVNAVSEENNKIIKTNASEIKSPLSWLWKKLFEAKVIDQGATTPEGHVGPYCEFHGEEGHVIQDCGEFRGTVQALMDNKEIEFFEEVDGSKIGTVERSSL